MVAETIEPIELAEAARERYLRYAMSVITSRALPDVRDGLKPVQRRILYAMGHDLHLGPTARPMKSAKVVGQVMGNYHPHGDTAIYDAMVRMAQPFSLRYPLVDGQGNFGAITGDSAAAFRYTEARLRALGFETLETLSEQTVELRPTYDESGREPEVLPVPVPLLLLNGASGIAVGMATNIPPHNLREVLKATTLLIDKPDSSIPQLLRSIKGPDFPTGGEVIATREELREIYEEGHGSIKLRGTYHLEEVTAKGKRAARTHIVVDSIPYGSSTGQVVAKMKELVEGRKLPQVAELSDQTNEDDGVRLVLELKGDAEADPAAIMAAVYRLTPLETTYSINFTALFPTGPGLLGRPERHCDLKTMLRAWLDFRFEVVTRSIEYRKARLEERIHILEGLATVLGKIDDAIKLVRGAADRPDARQRLMKRFKLSEAQAGAVLEIQLYRLAQLEVKKVQDELKEKQKEARRLGKLLQSDQPRWDLIKRELGEVAKRHGDERRTTFVGEVEAEHIYDPTALVVKEDTHVILTREGRVKRVRKLEDPDKIRVREGDELLQVLQGSTLAPVVFFTNFGSAYTLPIHDVPATTGFGEPIQKFFNFKDQERVVVALSLDERVLGGPGEKVTLLVGTKQAQVLQTPLQQYLEASTRAGRKFMRLGRGDEIVAVEALGPTRKKQHALLATTKGNALRVALDDVPSVAGVGKGKQGIALGKKEELVGLTAGPALLVENTRGGTVELAAKAIRQGALGEDGVDASGRFGFRRALLPPPELEPLDGEAEES